LLFWKSNMILHMIDECTRYSMLPIVTGKTEYDLCSALKTWWFRIFLPPKILLVDQEGGFAGDDAGMFFGT